MDVDRTTRECLLSGIVVAVLAAAMLAALLVYLVGVDSSVSVLAGVACVSSVFGCGVALAWGYLEYGASCDDERTRDRG